MRSPVFALIAIALLVPAARAAGPVRLVGIPAHVRSGSELRIRWTGLGHEAQEAELELSLSGDRWVRISPELEAREGGFTWRVPSGLSGPARLRLRFGGEGFEAEGGVSMPFVIEPDKGGAAMPVPDPALDDGWRLDDFAGASPLPQVSGAVSLRPAGPVLAITPDRDRLVWFAEPPARVSAEHEPLRARGEVVPRRGRVSRSYPLRI